MATSKKKDNANLPPWLQKSDKVSPVSNKTKTPNKASTKETSRKGK